MVVLLQWMILSGLAQQPATASAPNAGAAIELDRMVPARVVAAWFGRPEAEEQDANSADKLAAFLVLLKNAGMMPQQGRVLTDIFASWTMLGHRRHALALLDISARKIASDSYRLSDMHAILLIDSTGIARQLDRRVRDLLGTYGDVQNDQIEKLQVAGQEYFQLSDRRLPAWATVEWGTIGTVFVVGFGNSSFAAVANTTVNQEPALAADPWYTQAHTLCEGPTSKFELYAALGEVSHHLDKVLGGRAAAVLKALQMENSQKLLWTVGFRGRQMCSAATYRDEHDNDHYIPLTSNQNSDPAILAAVPPEASAYAPFRMRLRDTVYLARDGFLQSQSPGSREGYFESFAYLRQDYGCDVTGGLVEQLGEHLIFHTYPPHPLGLPLLCTIWIEINDRAPVADTINKLMAGWQKDSAQLGSNEPRPFSPAVKCTPDGIWYLQMGLLGPAVGVADGWVVISFSPMAVRKNLQYLARKWNPTTHPHAPYARLYQPIFSQVSSPLPPEQTTKPTEPAPQPLMPSDRGNAGANSAPPPPDRSTVEPVMAADPTPASQPAPDDAPSVRLHTVQPKETMASLALRYYGDRGQVWRIIQANPDQSPRRLKPGTVLRIPPGKSTTPPTDKPIERTR